MFYIVEEFSVKKPKSKSSKSESIKNLKKDNFSKSIIKGLSISSVIASMFAVPSSAAEALDLSQKPLSTPILDYLKNENILIPQVGIYDQTTKTWLDGTPIESPGSGYTLTPVDEESANTITNFIWDDEMQTLVPQYYSVDLKNASDPSTFGIPRYLGKPTLDYYKDNNILIPQAGVYDAEQRLGQRELLSNPQAADTP